MHPTTPYSLLPTPCSPPPCISAGIRSIAGEYTVHALSRRNFFPWKAVTRITKMLTIFDLDTPALLVDLDRLERNIADMAQVAKSGGKALRPHTKTHKTPEIARMQLKAGAEGLTVAKLGEAEALIIAGHRD